MRVWKGAILGALVLAGTMVLMSVTVAAAAPQVAAPLGPAEPGALSAGGAGPTILSNPSGLAMEKTILSTAQSDHIPIQAVSLPNLLGSTTTLNGVVTPNVVTPAPFGLGAYGIRNTTGTAQAFSFETQSWEGSITLNSPTNNLLLDNDGLASTNGAANEYGVQLNAVIANATAGSSSNYSFWTQNVLYFNFPYPGDITFLDNVWNFSSPAVSLTNGTLYSYNGTPVYPEYYYDFGPTYSISYPLTVHLYLNSSVTDIASTGYAYTTVRFGYDIVNPTSGRSEASGVYDTVLFNSTKAIGTVPLAPYLVDGSQVTPTGFIPWDAEIMLGGPGGGTTTSIYGISGSESLQYLNSTTGRYANAPSAWNVGGETGETSEGIAETYTSPGTVLLGAGPSLVTPLWNATPGGNEGRATFSGPLSPSNAFVFASPGNGINPNYAAWAPTQTASSVDYVLPPGQYTFEAMLSDYKPIVSTVSARAGGSAALPFTLSADRSEGVYTPLVAWDNAQIGAISSSGRGTAGSPYILDNNAAKGGLNTLFGQFNDYLFQVFPGVLLAGTTAYTDLNNPSLLGLTYQPNYQPILSELGLPSTNNLQFEFVNASHVSLWGAKGITGWFFYEDYGPTGFLPLANVVVWGGSDDLIGDNTFVSQGSSLVLAGYAPGPTGNVVWGNTFVNSTKLTPTMYPGDGVSNGPPIAIFAFEGGDLIYNNYVDTSITAFAPNYNMFFGSYQVNAESWNLSMVEPASYSTTFNGYHLTGAIAGKWQGGNFWADYDPAYGLPYDEYGYIATGGDYFPLPITAYSVTFDLSEHGPAVTWSVTLNGVTESTSGGSLVFYEVPGTYNYTATVTHGAGSISPSSGTVTVVDRNLTVDLRLN
jgi:thermopsin